MATRCGGPAGAAGAAAALRRLREGAGSRALQRTRSFREAPVNTRRRGTGFPSSFKERGRVVVRAGDPSSPGDEIPEDVPTIPPFAGGFFSGAADSVTGRGTPRGAAGGRAGEGKAFEGPPPDLSTGSLRTELGYLGDVPEEIMPLLMRLEGMGSMSKLMEGARGLSIWRESLSKGILPDPGHVRWPDEPFLSKFVEALEELEMARFCRRYPALLDSLLKQMMELVNQFEVEQEAVRAENAQQQQFQQSAGWSQQQGGAEDQEEGEEGESSAGPGSESMQEQMQDMMEDMMSDDDAGAADAEGQRETIEIQIQMEDAEGGMGMKDKMSEMAEEAAGKVIQEWLEEAKPAMEHMEQASKALGDLDNYLDGPEGFDLSRSVWKQSGWEELDQLRSKLEDLKELRELVRKLGRGGAVDGPLKRAPAQVESEKAAPGVIRSPIKPAETRSLTRSDDLSRMLPAEMALLASGIPQARLLHFARRAERSLMSYERVGWMEENAKTLTRLEVRPTAERGPIILCLDTSGSMRGARETVAKALALECFRGAHAQHRACFLYAFSGPGEVQELELKADTKSLEELLTFLAGSFHGGTDVDAPLELSLERLATEEWNMADILMVTDGEIAPPSDDLLDRIGVAVDEMELEVHGLIVSDRETDAMTKLCTHLHTFQSWSALR